MRLVLLLLGLVFLSGGAQQPLSLEAVAARYMGAQSYCDAGKRSWRDDPRQERATEMTFERCARRDGRFKYAERHAMMRGPSVYWADEQAYYRYEGHSDFFRKLSFDDPYLHGLYRVPGERYAVFVLRAFTFDGRNVADPRERERWLRAFQPSAALSTPTHTVFERPDGSYGSERIWVRSADRVITRFEYVRQGGVMRLTEIHAQELDRPLADADLRHEVGLLTRISPSNALGVFVSLLIAGCFLAAAAFWAWQFARAAHPQDVRDRRRRLWRWQLVAFGAVAALLGLLALVAPGGGHPPAIAFILAGGFWCAVAFGMTAAFLLASYPVERLLKARRAGPGPA